MRLFVWFGGCLCVFVCMMVCLCVDVCGCLGVFDRVRVYVFGVCLCGGGLCVWLLVCVRVC